MFKVRFYFSSGGPPHEFCILPCPKCKEKTVITHGRARASFDHFGKPFFIECETCGLHLEDDYEVDNLIKAWNKKANKPLIDAGLAALEMEELC